MLSMFPCALALAVGDNEAYVLYLETIKGSDLAPGCALQQSRNDSNTTPCVFRCTQHRATTSRPPTVGGARPESLLALSNELVLSPRRALRRGVQLDSGRHHHLMVMVRDQGAPQYCGYPSALGCNLELLI